MSCFSYRKVYSRKGMGSIGKDISGEEAWNIEDKDVLGDYLGNYPYRKW